MDNQGPTEPTECLIAMQPYLLNFIRQRVVNLEDAEDLTQETLLVAWLGVHRFRGGSDLETWVFGIARHKIIDMNRRLVGTGIGGVRERGLGYFLSVSRKVSFDLDYLLTRLDCDLILSSLADEDADLVRKYYIEGYSQGELGSVTGKSANAVKMKLGRLIKSLKPE